MKNDLISRKDAIDALNGRKTADQSPLGNARNTVIDWCIKFIKALPSAQPEPRWIPCSERLPDDTGYYLVWMPFAPPKHRITVAEYCGEYWNIKTPISAWMPLPEPYKNKK